jgi:hypothetical protein
MLIDASPDHGDDNRDIIALLLRRLRETKGRIAYMRNCHMEPSEHIHKDRDIFYNIGHDWRLVDLLAAMRDLVGLLQESGELPTEHLGTLRLIDRTIRECSRMIDMCKRRWYLLCRT